MNVAGQRLEDEELTLEQRILTESEEAAGEYLKATWFYRAMEGIREARIQSGLTQSDVAEKIGTTQSVIARLENAYEGTFSLNRFLEYAWASGAAPLDLTWVSPDELRAFAALNPAAPRTEEAVRLWTVLRRVWGLGEPNEGERPMQRTISTSLPSTRPSREEQRRSLNQYSEVANTFITQTSVQYEACEQKIGNAPERDEGTRRPGVESLIRLAS